MPSGTLRPNFVATAGQWGTGGTAPTLNEAVDDDPDAPDTADYIEDPLTAGTRTELGLSTVSLGASDVTLNSGSLKVYGVMGTEATTTPSWICELRSAAGTLICTVTFAEGTAESLRTASITPGAMSQTTVDGLQVWFTSTGDVVTALRRCYAVEVVLDWTIPGGRELLGVG